MLVAGLVSLLTFSSLVLGHGGPDISVLERAMHPREIASRQLATNKRHIQARQCADHIAAFQRKRKLLRRTLQKRVEWDPYVTAEEVEPQTTSITNTTCITAPEVTEGPYYLNNDLVRQDLRENEGGILLKLDIGVMDTSTCEPLPDALVEIWHANATGYYSGFGTGTGGGGGGRNGGKANSENFLRGGWQTNSNGIVEFLTVYPGYYTGRAIHIHLMVHQNITYNTNGTYSSRTGSLVHIGQMFFDDAFSDQIMAVAPYSNNQNTRQYNEADSIEAQQMANGYNAMVDVELLGSSVTDGIVGYITVGVNSQAEYEVTSFNYYDGLDGVVSSVWTASTRTAAGTAAVVGSSSSAALRADLPLRWLSKLLTMAWFE